MKILIVTQYFWPERFKINDLVLGLKERGFEIVVLTGKPNYPQGTFEQGYSFFKKGREQWEGINIYRSPLLPRGKGGGMRLMANYLSFAFFATLKALFIKERFDKIFVYEPSPVTVGIPAVMLGRKLKIPVYFWVQDLWPESVSAAGQIRNKTILNSLNRLTKWIYRNCEKILIQSEGFANYILNQGVPREKLIYYPNSTEAFYREVVPQEHIRAKVPQEGYRIMFAGNIGESQDFETILEAARIAIGRQPDIHFVILGDGRKKEFVEQKVQEFGIGANFHLLGSFPGSDMPDFFACADALLVCLKNNPAFDLTIPSKVQSYLACARPIIGSLNGEGARIIDEAKAGVVAPAGQPELLAEKILTLYAAGAEASQVMGRNAKHYFDQNFERELLLDKLIAILEDKKS
ncbi:glycosyltransferase family 4 protein [Taibaiella chishuiensis]|uniref:Glycosyltransferase involved in cell wall biosynthesis n=1 Tax=Taibaiella chishuiensis TaxID=1434707 RepID=A0A2P8DB89_9BACT|nr:glycosyltransferase family 4 protein [Taibaiella chishuiensis]PSK94469.1 glycosyltransferase involved in cell wall biosynthesis [Taibaiella chishuiensis]